MSTSPVSSANNSTPNFWNIMLGFGSEAQTQVINNLKVQVESELGMKNSAINISTNKQKDSGATNSSLTDKALQYLGINKAADGTRTGIFSDISDWFANSTVGKWFNSAVPEVASSTASVATTAGTAVSAATGAAASGAATAAGAASPLSMGTSLVSAATGAFDMIKSFGHMTLEHGLATGLTTGASIGMMVGNPLLGAAIGAVAGGIMSLFKNSGKPKEQKERDKMRKALQQTGIIDDKFTIGLADGTRYDVGIDGKAKPEFGNRKPFEIDPSNQLAQSVNQVFMQLANRLFQGNTNLTTSLAGYLTNASLSNANGDQAAVQKNMEAIFAQFAPVLGGATSTGGTSTVSQSGATANASAVSNKSAVN